MLGGGPRGTRLVFGSRSFRLCFRSVFREVLIDVRCVDAGLRARRLSCRTLLDNRRCRVFVADRRAEPSAHKGTDGRADGGSYGGAYGGTHGGSHGGALGDAHRGALRRAISVPTPRPTLSPGRGGARLR